MSNGGNGNGGTTQLLGVLRGTINDADTSLPIEGATVSIPALELTAVADSEGVYSIEDITPGTYTVDFSAEGYQSQTVEDFEIGEETVTLDIAMEAEVVEEE